MNLKYVPWLKQEILTNKIKNKLKIDSQYVSVIEVYLDSIEEFPILNILPEMKIKIKYPTDLNPIQKIID
jgi:hypothetical protein